jgi:hypothetical protein
MTKETIYIDVITKLNELDDIINELAGLLDEVLDAWRIGSSTSEEIDLYVKANDYLKGLRDEHSEI